MQTQCPGRKRLHEPQATAAFQRKILPDKGSLVDPKIIRTEPLAYWSPHHLLGLFLSFTPAPAAAQWDNFYVPLLYVYGRWAALLAPSWKGGTGLEPYMTQATWYNNSDNRRYHLGCSMAGYSNEGDAYKWRTDLGMSRFNILNFVDKGRFPFTKSPEVIRKGYIGTKLGSCAETYPFATFFRLALPDVSASQNPSHSP